MGYFSNGTEGVMYQERYCERCVHFKPEDGGCMVWLAHIDMNYKQHDVPAVKEILDLLIPREGIENQECSMFYAADPNRCPDTLDMFKEGGDVGA